MNPITHSCKFFQPIWSSSSLPTSVESEESELSIKSYESQKLVKETIAHTRHLSARTPSSRPPLICCVDGNIGCGKSTVLSFLKDLGFLVFEEDLDNWGTLLDKFYTDPKRWMCTLQVKILHSMRKQYENMSQISATQHPVVFIERSPLSSMLFVLNGVQNKYLDFEETQLICQVYRDIFWKPDISFYIDTDVDECFKRKVQRNRECEANVDKAYLQTLHNGYFRMYSNNTNTCIIEGRQTPEHIAKDILQALKLKSLD